MHASVTASAAAAAAAVVEVFYHVPAQSRAQRDKNTKRFRRRRASVIAVVFS